MDTNWKYCTLPTAKRLRELGLKQGMTERSWAESVTGIVPTRLIPSDKCGLYGWGQITAAPDLSEAMRVLEKHGCNISFGPSGGIVMPNALEKGGIRWDNETIFPAEAACHMIVWLAEQGLINLKEIRLTPNNPDGR